MTVTQSLVLTPQPRASGASKGSRLQKNLPDSTGTGREDRLSSPARRPGRRGALESPLESRPGIRHQEPGAGGGGQSPGRQAGDPRETGRGPPPSAFGGCGRTGLWQPAPAPCSHVQSGLPAPEAAPPTCGCRAPLLLPLITWHLARPGSGQRPQATGWARVLPARRGSLRAENVGPREHPQSHEGHTELLPKVKALSTVILFLASGPVARYRAVLLNGSLGVELFY